MVMDNGVVRLGNQQVRLRAPSGHVTLLDALPDACDVFSLNRRRSCSARRALCKMLRSAHATSGIRANGAATASGYHPDAFCALPAPPPQPDHRSAGLRSFRPVLHPHCARNSGRAAAGQLPAAVDGRANSAQAL